MKMELKSDSGKKLEVQYNKMLSFYYGDKIKMLSGLELSQQKYLKDKNMTDKVRQRIDNLNDLILLACQKIDASITDQQKHT
jgi:hypothetical protein